MELVDNYYNDAEHIETVICCPLSLNRTNKLENRHSLLLDGWR